MKATRLVQIFSVLLGLAIFAGCGSEEESPEVVAQKNRTLLKTLLPTGSLSVYLANNGYQSANNCFQHVTNGTTEAVQLGGSACPTVGVMSANALVGSLPNRNNGDILGTGALDGIVIGQFNPVSGLISALCTGSFVNVCTLSVQNTRMTGIAKK